LTSPGLPVTASSLPGTPDFEADLVVPPLALTVVRRRDVHVATGDAGEVVLEPRDSILDAGPWTAGDGSLSVT